MKNNAWIFYSEYIYDKKIESGYKDEIIKKALEEYHFNLEVKNIHKCVILSGEKNQLYYDGKLVKNLPKVAIFRRYEIYLARQLEKLGVIVINSTQSMIDARNKMKTHQILASKQIKTPKTVYVVPRVCLKNLNYQEVSKIFDNKKFVMKWIYGAAGTHVFLVDNEEEFNRIMKEYNGKVLSQEFISSSFGKDVRAYVIGGKYLASAIRESDNDFRSNLAKGGHALSFDANQKIKEIAEASANAVGLDICGVDILFGENDEYYICEVNALPGFKSIKKTSGIDEKDILCSLIRDKLNN